MKRLRCLFLMLGFSSASFGQTTLIPDPNFEQALIDFGYDTAPINGSVLTANISGVTDLNVDNKNITDLTGIEDFTALTFLSCYTNQLTSLDVSNNISLQGLNCNQNQLTSLDVSNNTALIQLQCGSNQLTSLNVSNNTVLSYLRCSDNQLTSLDVSNSISLNNLLCEINQLTSLDVSSNTVLNELKCSNNQLTSLDVSNNITLNNLSCYDNQLTSLDVSSNTALEYLRCDDNQLTSLDVSNNITLNNLSCYDNQLTSLDVSINTALIQLRCGSNQLTSLNVRNGNNENIIEFNSIENPDLACIFVDDASYSIANWLGIDPNSTFVENEAECEALAVTDNSLDVGLIIHPNPTDNYLFIQGITSQLSATVYNMLGEQVLITQNTDKIDVSGLSDGIYIIQISDGVNETQRKFIKN